LALYAFFHAQPFVALAAVGGVLTLAEGGDSLADTVQTLQVLSQRVVQGLGNLTGSGEDTEVGGVDRSLKVLTEVGTTGAESGPLGPLSIGLPAWNSTSEP
jgi:hypothetical protein